MFIRVPVLGFRRVVLGYFNHCMQLSDFISLIYILLLNSALAWDVYMY